ncbi:MAG: serpin family protein [Gemmatimonadales bacterium]|nr:MAG: serpin family protein [Gemmatimonadales bacterium]
MHCTHPHRPELRGRQVTFCERHGRSRPGRAGFRAAPFPSALVASVLVAVVLLTGGCEWITGPSDGDPGPAPAITELPRALTGAEVEAIRASNAFGFNLLREVSGETPDESVFLSPFSASMALGMTMNGADGATFDAMRSTLRFGELSEEEINQSYRGLMDLLGELDPRVELRIGNAIWHRDQVTVRSEFRERVEAAFDARVQGLDFSDPGAADVINAWVRDATNDRIDEMVQPPIPAQVVAYLMNAVYFNAGWTEPFDPDLTRTGRFEPLAGAPAEVEFMVRDDTLRYNESERWRAVDLPYAGQAWAMTVVVPRDGTTVHDLIDELDPEGWDALTAGFQTARTMLSLPRFELEWEGVLNDALKRMGMEVAFDGGADFSRMFEGTGAWIDEVKQKSFVRVDEEGTEAAAVTSVTMVTSMPPEVRADRPFLFAVRERLSGTILFMGAIVEPPTM